MLPVSRRCSRLAAKCLRPAGIPVLLGTATPGSSPPPIYATGKMERVGGKITKDCKARIPAGWGEKKTRKKSAGEIDPERIRRAVRWPIADPSESPTPATAEPHPHPCYHRATTEPRRPRRRDNASRSDNSQAGLGINPSGQSRIQITVPGPPMQAYENTQRPFASDSYAQGASPKKSDISQIRDAR